MHILAKDDEYNDLLTSIKAVYGYDFTNYALPSIKRRIAHYSRQNKITDLKALKSSLLSDASIFEDFVQSLSVTVTALFRDPAFYSSLREKVLNRLGTYPVLKIWVAGCATGEEVYSVAILLHEAGLLQRSLIYATDINNKSLSTAKEGIYNIANMQAYTINYQNAGGQKSLSEYYTAHYNAVLFNRLLKKNIVFAHHNLAVDRFFNEFQLIICRNVLIYFNQHLQNKVFHLFYDSLCTFGFLGLGNKESLLFSDKKPCFEETDKKEKIFKKIM